MLRAKAALQEENYKKADQILKEAEAATQSIDDQTFQVVSLRAHSAFLDSRVEDATSLLEHFAEKAKEEGAFSFVGSLYLQLFGYYFEADRLKDAEVALSQIQKDPVLDVQVRLSRAKLLIKSQKAKEAEKELSSLLAQLEVDHPSRAEALYQRGFARMQTSQLEGAEEDFKASQKSFKAAGREREAVLSVMAQANLLVRLGKLDAALLAYEELLVSDLKGAGLKGDVENALAFLLSEQGHYKKALEHSKKAENAHKSDNLAARVRK